MKKCSKCFSEHEDESFVKYCEYPHLQPMDKNDPPQIIERIDYNLCYRCNDIFSNEVVLLREFMKEDCGSFPMSQPDKNIINARRKRNLGQSPWKEKENG